MWTAAANGMTLYPYPHISLSPPERGGTLLFRALRRVDDNKHLMRSDAWWASNAMGRIQIAVRLLTITVRSNPS